MIVVLVCFFPRVCSFRLSGIVPVGVVVAGVASAGVALAHVVASDPAPTCGRLCGRSRLDCYHHSLA